MKTLPKLILLLLLIFIVGGIYYKFFYTNNNAGTATEELVVDQTITAEVTPLNPLVNRLDSNGAETVIEARTQVTQGDTITTGSEGRALIESPIERLVLNYDTTLVVSELATAAASKRKITAGGVWTQVEKVFEQGEFYELETANAVASVRGTSFGLSYGDGTTNLIVTEGSVALTPIDPATESPDPFRETIVTAGQKAEVTDNGTPVVSDITAEDKQQEWYMFNNKDEEEVPEEKPQVIATTTVPVATTSLLSNLVSVTILQEEEVIATTTEEVATTTATTTEPEEPQTPTYEEELFVENADPAQITTTEDIYVIVYGGGFLGNIDLVFGGSSIQGIEIFEDGIEFLIPSSTPDGTYTVSVNRDDGASARLVEPISINRQEG